MTSRRPVLAACVAALLLAPAACSHRSATAPAMPAPGSHKDQPPHGGTVIDLGQDLYHLEMLRDPDAGTLTVWVLDGEMDEFIRISQSSLPLEWNGHPAVLHAVASSATGETVGDTSEFQLQADWVKRTPAFHGRIGPITVRGTPFAPVTFAFP